MSAKKAHEIFNAWFDQHGHWMFGTNGKEKAIAAREKYGIEGLPKFQSL